MNHCLPEGAGPPRGPRHNSVTLWKWLGFSAGLRSAEGQVSLRQGECSLRAPSVYERTLGTRPPPSAHPAAVQVALLRKAPRGS